MADVVVLNKLDSAELDAAAQVVADVQAANPHATIVRATSPVTLEPGPSLAGKRVLVVEDGPTITHGGVPFGAGTVAARHAGVTEFIDPRPFRRRLDRRHVREVPSDRPGSAGDGLRRGPTRRTRPDHPSRRR